VKKIIFGLFAVASSFNALAQERIEKDVPETHFSAVLTRSQVKQSDNYRAVVEVVNTYTNKRVQRIVLGDEYEFLANPSESLQFADLNMDGYDDIIVNNGYTTNCGYWTTHSYVLLYNAKSKKFSQSSAYDDILYAGHFNEAQVEINYTDSTIKKYKQTCQCAETSYGYNLYKVRKGKLVLHKSIFVLCPHLDIERETGSREVVFGTTTNGKYGEYTKRLTAVELRGLAGTEILAVE
jgi:hypothetical protein